MTDRFQRQVGIINVKEFKENRIAIVGCGAVGSYVACSLAKMGMKEFVLWDFDKIEEHNLPNQFFGDIDIGSSKVLVTRNNMKYFNNDAKIDIIDDRFIKSSSLKKIQIVVSCVDNMDVRKQIFENCKRDKVELFIDTRMGGLQGQVYSVDMENKKEVKYYEETLFPQSEAPLLRCTERSIIFTVLGIASIVCGQIVKALKGEKVKNFIVLDYITPQMF